jgi:CubicO group peptidase (beta-lactamase class C family)
VLVLMFYGYACAQTDIVKSQGITGPLHQANLGKIIFTAKAIPVENLKETDFLKTIELKEKADLNFRGFMGNSLTNYLHALAPQLSVDQLGQQGNFQLSFMVDGALVYQANLHPATVPLESKNTETTFGFPFLNSANPEAGATWKRFLFDGGDQALTPGKHLLKLELRPYLRDPDLKVGQLIAQGELQLIVPEKSEVDKKLSAIQPIKPSSGWKISQASYDQAKIEELNRKIAENFYRDITSLVVIEDGKLLIEEYFNGATRDTLHNTRSVGKSFLSPIMGIAIGEGHIKSENQTLKDFYDLQKFANYSPRKETVTLKSLLTMSSGFNGNDDEEESPGNEEKMYPTADWVKFALDVPMDDKKKVGEKWAYFTAGVVVLGDIVNKSVPEGLEKYADKKLFKPLGITKYVWGYTPQKVPNTAGGIQLRTLDLARFGELHRNGGRWNGKQIIPRDWVEKALTKQIGLDSTTNYGYLFWNTTFNISGKKHEVFFATGNGGSKIFVFKDRPLVIVITSTAYGKWYMHAQAFNMMNRYILPAITK